nr:ribosomal protein L18 [Chroomonas debatzensis]
MTKTNVKAIDKVKARIRQKVKGTSVKPRLSVFRSNENIYAQIIDDSLGKTLVSSSTLDKDIKAAIKSGATCEASELVGKAIAKKSLENQISTVIFDRGGRLYHGRIKALADAAREEGLNF